jgi:hypothetical protein
VIELPKKKFVKGFRDAYEVREFPINFGDAYRTLVESARPNGIRFTSLLFLIETLQPRHKPRFFP